MPVSIEWERSLSISIVIYDTPLENFERNLVKALSAVKYLEKNQSPVQWTYIYIINNSKIPLADQLAPRIDKDLKRVKCSFFVLEGHGNIGYGSAQNLVLAEAVGEVHVFMNPDVVLAEDSLAQGLKYLDKEHDVVALSPKCSDLQNNKQPLCKRYPSIFDLFVRGFFSEKLRKVFNKRLSNYEMRDLSDSYPSHEIPIISGCFMMCRSKAVFKVGGFDPKYFLYFEDFDLSLRLREVGRLAYVPTVSIIHTGGNASKKGLRHIMLFVKSAIKFFNTYGWKWT